ncbi:MAG: acyl-CoA dehydrogenase family protein, partial [Candidatus Lambdaproteobacteria bacterium]|nr:acyl-CoA dehydrogenase family protein [Candidatus Lambdaproteobacteria bacterium]
MADVNYFKSDIREMEFALFEHFKLGELLAAKPYDHISAEDARLILKEAHHFATEVIGPTMQSTDQEGAKLTKDGVKVPRALHTVYKQFYENGWNTLTLPEAAGGQGAPMLLGVAVT